MKFNNTEERVFFPPSGFGKIFNLRISFFCLLIVLSLSFSLSLNYEGLKRKIVMIRRIFFRASIFVSKWVDGSFAIYRDLHNVALTVGGILWVGEA